MKKAWISFLAAISWLIVSFILLTLPGSDLPKEEWLDKIWIDKWVHIGMFGMLAVLWCNSWRFVKVSGDYNKRRRIFILIGISCLAYGIAMEFVQKDFASQRSFDLTDILADGIGSAAGTIFSIKRYIKK